MLIQEACWLITCSFKCEAGKRVTKLLAKDGGNGANKWSVPFVVEDTPIGGAFVGMADHVFSDLQRSLRVFQVLTHREAMEALHTFCLF